MAEPASKPNVLLRSAAFIRGGAARLWRTLPALGGLALIALAGIWAYQQFLHEPKETYGRLLVDSPEIYTRERLVNDRFVEDAWLRRKLRDSSEADFGPTASLSTSQLVRASAARKGSGAPARDEAAATLPDQPAARRAAPAQFRSELEYRGEIRNLIIENQLDDRHDLRGNSLYRLKFDASILPGRNTRANALISLILEEHEQQILAENNLFFDRFSEQELKGWRRLYDEWLRSIEENINQSVGDLKYEYENDRFSAEYFEDLVEVMYALPQRCVTSELQALKGTPEESGRVIDSRAAFENIRSQIIRKCSEFADTAGKAEPAAVAPTAVTRQSNPDAPSTRQITRSNPAARQANTCPTAAVVERRDQTAEGSLSLNNLINRFAAPKLAQLAFGTGRIGGKADSNVQQWDIFFPYATVNAVYADDRPFRVSAINKPWRIKPVSDATGGQCDRSRELDLTSQGKTQYCIDRNIGSAERIISTLNISPDDLYAVLKEKIGEEQRKNAENLAGGAEGTTAGCAAAALPPGTVDVTVVSGLFAFIRALQQSRSVFSYAVTPKQATQTLGIDAQDRRRAAVAAGLEGIVGEFVGDRSSRFSGVREQPLVVGYGNVLGKRCPAPERAGEPAEAATEPQSVPGDDSPHCPRQIEFGWFISPPVQDADGQGAQLAAQYALTALVSVPAWWDRINLRVERAWLDADGVKRDENGNRLGAEDSAVDQDGGWWLIDPVMSAGEAVPSVGDTAYGPITEIDLPRDLESISSLLLDQSAGPEIDEARMEPIYLTACRPASLLLPGRRLWRSAIVTLGSQVADEIHVLPNMRGIIARFDQIDMPTGKPAGAKDASADPASNVFEAPVTVWTSQGSRTLRNRARVIVLPAGDEKAIQAGEDKVRQANGTCQPLKTITVQATN